MFYFIIAWMLVGYWCAGAWIAYVIAVNRFENTPPSELSPAIERTVGMVLGIIFTIAGPLTLFLFKKKGGKTPDDQFADSFMREVKRSFLHPRKNDFFWPITVLMLY